MKRRIFLASIAVAPALRWRYATAARWRRALPAGAPVMRLRPMRRGAVRAPGPWAG